MNRRRTSGCVFLALVVVLAGCTGGVGGQSPESATTSSDETAPFLEGSNGTTASTADQSSAGPAVNASGDFYYEYDGDMNDGVERVVVPKEDLDGPGRYEVTVNYSLRLAGSSGEADLKFWLRTDTLGDTEGGTRLERLSVPLRTNETETVTDTVTRTVRVGSNDPGVVLWCHADNEVPGTSGCEAAVSVTEAPDSTTDGTAGDRASYDFYYEYGGDMNDGVERVVVPKEDLDGPGRYEVTVNYSLHLAGNSGEADLKFWLRTDTLGDTEGGTRFEHLTVSMATNATETLRGTATRTVRVGSADAGVVLWCHADNEVPGTSACAANVSVSDAG